MTRTLAIGSARLYRIAELDGDGSVQTLTLIDPLDGTVAVGLRTGLVVSTLTPRGADELGHALIAEAALAIEEQHRAPS